MADGAFPSLVSATRDVNAVTNPIFVRLTDGTTAIGVTSNALDVNIAGGSLSVNAEKVDDSAFTIATDYVMVNGYLADETTPDSVDEGDVGAARMTLDRKQLMVLVDPTTDANRLAIDASGYATVNVNGSVTVTASDLDIRDLTHVSDSVSIGDGTTLADVLDGTIDALYTAITDGTDTWSIDGSGYGQVDIAAQSLTAVKISKDANANTETNPIFVKVVDTVVSGEEVHDYDTASAVASDATSNHDYTVAGTTFFLKSVIVSGSGNIKFEVQTGPVASLATVAVGFLTGRQGDTKQIFFDPAVEVPVTSTGTVRIIRTNRQGSATDLYSTIIGNDV